MRAVWVTILNRKRVEKDREGQGVWKANQMKEVVRDGHSGKRRENKRRAVRGQGEASNARENTTGKNAVRYKKGENNQLEGGVFPPSKSGAEINAIRIGEKAADWDDFPDP